MTRVQHPILFFIFILFVSCLGFTQDISRARIDLQIGDQASAFQANDDQGNLWKFSDFVGKKYLVFYFYPAAMTGG